MPALESRFRRQVPNSVQTMASPATPFRILASQQRPAHWLREAGQPTARSRRPCLRRLQRGPLTSNDGRGTRSPPARLRLLLRVDTRPPLLLAAIPLAVPIVRPTTPMRASLRKAFRDPRCRRSRRRAEPKSEHLISPHWEQLGAPCRLFWEPSRRLVAAASVLDPDKQRERQKKQAEHRDTGPTRIGLVATSSHRRTEAPSNPEGWINPCSSKSLYHIVLCTFCGV